MSDFSKDTLYAAADAAKEVLQAALTEEMRSTHDIENIKHTVDMHAVTLARAKQFSRTQIVDYLAMERASAMAANERGATEKELVALNNTTMIINAFAKALGISTDDITAKVKTIDRADLLTAAENMDAIAAALQEEEINWNLPPLDMSRAPTQEEDDLRMEFATFKMQVQNVADSLPPQKSLIPQATAELVRQKPHLAIPARVVMRALQLEAAYLQAGRQGGAETPYVR